MAIQSNWTVLSAIGSPSLSGYWTAGAGRVVTGIGRPPGAGSMPAGGAAVQGDGYSFAGRTTRAMSPM